MRTQYQELFMIFNPLFNLVSDNQEGVRLFLCNFFYENNLHIDKKNSIYITEKLNIFSKSKSKDTEEFINLFRENEYLYNALSLLKSENKYGFFTNGKRVYISTLDGPSLALTICYLNTFGYSNVQN